MSSEGGAGDLGATTLAIAWEGGLGKSSAASVASVDQNRSARAVTASISVAAGIGVGG